MHILPYLTYVYIKNELRNTGKVLTYLLLIFAAFYNGYLARIMLLEELHWNQARMVLSILIFMLIIIRRGTITPFQLVNLVKPLHPPGSFNRFLTNIINDSILSIYFILISCFTFSILYNSTDISEWLWMGCVIVGSYLLRRGLIVTIVQKSASIKSKVFISLMWASVIVLYFGNIIIPNQNFWLFPASIMCIVVIVYFLEEFITSPPLSSHSSNSGGSTSYSLSILIYNRDIRSVGLLAISIKLIFLTLLTVGYHKKANPELIPFIFLFTSPVIMFNYLLNNLFGYLDRYWFLIDKSTNSGHIVISYFLRIFKNLLLADIIVTILILIFLKEHIIILLVSYLGQLILFVPLAFYWSVEFPKQVSLSLFNPSPMIGFIPALVSIIICSPFVFGYRINLLVISTSIIYIISGIILLFKYKDYYKNNRLMIFQKLFK